MTPIIMTLPQYLLARADSKLASARWFRLRPAVNARWSASRVLGMIAIKTILFAAAGLALSLLVYRQFVGWPVWWLGLFAFCHGVVKYGLTALCWNQRAERLRADPQLPIGLPRSRFFPARGFLWLAYFLLVSVVTPLAMWITIENVRGKLAWAHYKHEWEAKGEKFDEASAIPPPVPDDQNLAMTPLLRPIYDFVQGTNGMHWRDTNGYAHLESISASLTANGSHNKFPGTGNLEDGTLANLESLQIFYRDNPNYPQPATPGTPAQDVLTALGKFDADLGELSGAAATRPLSRFPIHYWDEPVWQILLPHLAKVRGLCQVYQLRAIARLELHQTDGAFADLKTGFRLSDSIRDEPFLIDHLVRLATLTMGLEVVREGLVRHAWTDAQLAELEKHLGSVDLLAEYEHAMRSERCCNISGLEYLARGDFLTHDPGFFFAGEDGNAHSAPFLPIIANGWLYQNMIETARLHQEFLLPAADERQHRVFRKFTDRLEQVLAEEPRTPYNVMTKMLVPSLAKAVMKSARVQTSVDAARVACALERFRLANGNYPATLDALAPQFTDKIPNDVIDGKPLRYRKNSGGGYVLYSIGWNEKDDGGIVAPGKGKTSAVNSSEGDWVWQMPAR